MTNTKTDQYYDPLLSSCTNWFNEAAVFTNVLLNMMFTLLFNLCLFIFGNCQNDKVLIPVLSKIKTIVSDPNATIRDPTDVIYDSVTSTWNFWATRINGTQDTHGYNGTIYHYYSSQ